MAAILVIEDDHNLKGLIEKILPGSQIKVLGNHPEDPVASLMTAEEQKRGNREAALEGIVREFLQAEADIGNEDHIHGSIIGRVERALIGILLEQEHGNQLRAAKRLGINRNTLRKKIKELQISTRVVSH
ncbi:MAG TPA: helix-turn-helix domain-containing protein [Thermodesulfobacteriota bacterium]|nr:helix-turn-helix domain-containing protein [Thermodesulfobacteriota bacterium]